MYASFQVLLSAFVLVAKTWSHVGGVDSHHVLDLQNATRKNLICEEEKQKNPTCLSAHWLVMWISFRDLWMVLNINSQCQKHLTQMRCIQFNPLTFYVFCKSVDPVFRYVRFAWYWIFSVLKLVQSLQVPPWEKVLESYRTDPRIPLYVVSWHIWTPIFTQLEIEFYRSCLQQHYYIVLCTWRVPEMWPYFSTMGDKLFLVVKLFNNMTFRKIRQKLASMKVAPAPLEMRFVEPIDRVMRQVLEPRWECVHHHHFFQLNFLIPRFFLILACWLW